jgi:DNA-binding response OmpR family regulator
VLCHLPVGPTARRPRKKGWPPHEDQRYAEINRQLRRALGRRGAPPAAEGHRVIPAMIQPGRERAAAGAKKVLVVDDDDSLRQSLAEQLRLFEEFVVIEAATGGAALEIAKADHFDVLLLDVGLPDMDGREVCRLLRRAGSTVPIIMLTGADTDADTILGLDSGANDYITKPFRLNVLLARLRAQLRQHEHSEGAVFTIGPYSFRPSAKLLLNEQTSRKIRLTEKETAILKYLYRAGDRVVGRDTLLGEVWGYNAGVTTHTLETHVYRLRQKIERDPSQAEILVTEPGGYRLVP